VLRLVSRSFLGDAMDQDAHFSLFSFLFFMYAVCTGRYARWKRVPNFTTVILGTSHLALTVPALLDLSDTMVQQWRAELRDSWGAIRCFFN
jgi:hypothetical protein